MKIGRVTHLADLGRGAGSQVFLVRREEDGHLYALKVVPVGDPKTRKFLAQARKEYDAGQLIDHPNLMKVHCLELDGGWFHRLREARLLLEYVPGVTMNTLPVLPVGRLVRVFERVAGALAHMHGRGVVHADMKPHNLILDRGTQVKVIDYGLARIHGEVRVRVQGTPGYMAPETASHKLVDERTDVFSLGATMYRLLTGQTPPQVAECALLGEQHFNRSLRPVGEFNPAAPGELCDLIRRCLSYSPDRRPASMEEVRDILNDLAEAQENRLGPAGSGRAES
ncbi:MAG TPA: serine/threonine-protein kinase [Gemmataceae bacterium]|nr:serine/threonine-protein kinase [Gemmataceae bacterium]